MSESQDGPYVGTRQIFRDTYGPTKYHANNGYDPGSESSSIQSSTQELSLAEEHGLRTSFREQPTVRLEDDGNTDATGASDATAVKTSNIHVYAVPKDTEINTPDSAASSTTLLLRQTGGKSGLVMDVGKLQANYDQGQNNINAKSMRTELSKDIQYENERSGEFDRNPFSFDTRRTVERSNTKSDRKCVKTGFIKYIACIMIVLAMIGGMVVLVYFKRNSNGDSDRQLGGVKTTDDTFTTGKPKVPRTEACPTVDVALQGMITIICNDVKRLDHLSYILMDPPPYVNEGHIYNISIETEGDNAPWILSVESGYRMERLILTGQQATCSSSGVYKLGLYDDANRHIEDKVVNITVESELMKVNITLNQTLAENNGTDYKIGCSTNSGCEQSYVDFFAKLEHGEEQYLRGVNFTCTIAYTDYTGYSVSCVGVIPDFLLSQFERITCKPRSSLLDDLDEEEIEELITKIELPKCDLSKNCNYECNDPSPDYFAVDTGRCDIFHRCVGHRVYTQFCAPGTFFDPGQCSCRHTLDLSWCREDGLLLPNNDVSDKICKT